MSLEEIARERIETMNRRYHLQADEFFPTTGDNSIIPLIERLNQSGVLTVIQPKERANSSF